MSSLDLLLLLSLATCVLAYVRGADPKAGWQLMGAYGAQLLLLFWMSDNFRGAETVAAGFSMSFLDLFLKWEMSGLGWFFALITVGAALFTSWYSAGAWAESQKNMRLQHTLLAVNVLAMLILLSSADFLSLFIGWELVSWASFLIMAQNGGKAADAAFRYLMYAMLGAMAIFAGLVLIYLQLGTLDYSDFWLALPNMSSGMGWSIVLLLGSGFAIKMALMPFHLWQAEAYAETPGASAAFVSAIAARMGLFAMAISMLTPESIEGLAKLSVPFTFMNAQGLIVWIAALTAIVPTYIALQQSDARLLLAWHGIGQGGFMLLGLAVATPMSVAGGLMHVFNYATYQAALFLAVTAVAYRTGTTDLDRLGGLIKRMPLTYVALLMGIIGLAGLPPMNGFVSKWLMYKSLLDAGNPLLLIAASISTLGTILSVYKLIHNIFLGQLRREHYGVKEVPWSMSLPMLILGGIGFLTGFMPGLALDLVDKAQVALGFVALPHHLGGVTWPTGSLNMLWVVGIFFYGVGIGAIIFFLGNRRHITHQWDNYAGGHFLTADTPYHYSHNFYPGVMRVIGDWFWDVIGRLEQGLINFVHITGGGFHSLYRLAYTPLYLLAASVLLLAWAV